MYTEEVGECCGVHTIYSLDYPNELNKRTFKRIFNRFVTNSERERELAYTIIVNTVDDYQKGWNTFLEENGFKCVSAPINPNHPRRTVTRTRTWVRLADKEV